MKYKFSIFTLIILFTFSVSVLAEGKWDKYQCQGIDSHSSKNHYIVSVNINDNDDNMSLSVVKGPLGKASLGVVAIISSPLLCNGESVQPAIIVKSASDILKTPLFDINLDVDSDNSNIWSYYHWGDIGCIANQCHGLEQSYNGNYHLSFQVDSNMIIHYFVQPIE